MSTSLYALGRWAYRHHRRVLLTWIALLLGIGGLALGLGGTTQNSFEIPGTESQDAVDALDRTFPELSGAKAVLVVVAPEGESVDSETSRALLDSTIERIKDVDGVRDAISPFSDLTDIGVSPDRTAAQVQVQLTGGIEDVTADQQDALVASAEPLGDAGYTAAFGGDAFTNTGPILSPVELIGVAIAFGVLYLMFRSWRAAVLPIVTALLGTGVTIGLTYVATSFMTISATAPLLAVMIGLAVGIDYALFVVSRHREQLLAGVDPEESAGRAVATSGSAVVFAGVTVIIALLGLAIARIPFLTVMGVVAAVSVVISVAVALTLLPALFGRAGDRLRQNGDHPVGGFSRRWAEATTRFPWIAIAVVTVGLAVATIPAPDLRLALPDNGTAPHGSSQREAFDLIDEHFGPGHNGSLLVTVDVIGTLDPLGVVATIADDVRAVPGVEAIGLATPNPTGDTAVVQVVPTTGPSDERTKDLVDELRARAPGWEADLDVDIAVTGLTAGGIDVSERLSDALLPFGLVVVGLSVLLLMIVFRTIVVPLKATIGFILSTGAAFGAVVAVFQWGWLADLVMLDDTGPLISFLPIICVAMLFGLAMDYEVFLMSRMKEEYVRSGDPHTAIVDGFVGSSRVVTAAAVIMLAVFAAFVPDGDPNIKPIAFALAVGVFADAFLVRMFFAPAVLQLFGRASWALPRRLERLLPHLDVEGEGVHRRVDLADWPEPGSTAAVTAEDLPIGAATVTFAVPAGGRLLVHGPSGSGRTALLLTLAGRMPSSGGRLRVLGHLLPQDAVAARRDVALAEFRGVNDLDDHLTIDQHVAERLSASHLSPWVSRTRIVAARSRITRALDRARTAAGIASVETDGATAVAALAPLERLVLAVGLAVLDDPGLVVIDDVDALRTPDQVRLFWAAVDDLLGDRPVAVAASATSTAAAPPGTHVLRLELPAPDHRPLAVPATDHDTDEVTVP